jgi:hypothetical protein
MQLPPEQPSRFKESLVSFLTNPLFGILGWIIQLVLYSLCWLAIRLNRLRNRSSSVAAEKNTPGYGTKWEIKQAFRDEDAGLLTAIFSIYIWCAIGIGLFVIMLVQYTSFPITIPMAIIGIPVFLAWCCGLIKGSSRWRIGLLCIITGLLGGIAAVRWPDKPSEDHWTWVILFILGGAALLWQSWKNHSSTTKGEEK